MWPTPATRVFRYIGTCARIARRRAAGILTVLCLSAFVFAGIANTKHNLSVSGPGTIKSPTETRICVFCHTPHNADPSAPLWNRSASNVYYEMYWSSTMQAYSSAGAAPQPDGSSKLCLSCHDGTIALGSVRSRSQPIPVSGGSRLPSTSSAYLGTDLSGSHPISFVYDDTLAIENNAAGDMPLRLPSTLTDPDVKLDRRGKIQCTTCHDPHSDRNEYFLVKPGWSELCLTCHDY